MTDSISYYPPFLLNIREITDYLKLNQMLKLATKKLKVDFFFLKTELFMLNSSWLSSVIVAVLQILIPMSLTSKKLYFSFFMRRKRFNNNQSRCQYLETINSNEAMCAEYFCSVLVSKVASFRFIHSCPEFAICQLTLFRPSTSAAHETQSGLKSLIWCSVGVMWKWQN